MDYYNAFRDLVAQPSAVERVNMMQAAQAQAQQQQALQEQQSFRNAMMQSANQQQFFKNIPNPDYISPEAFQVKPEAQGAQKFLAAEAVGGASPNALRDLYTRNVAKDAQSPATQEAIPHQQVQDWGQYQAMQQQAQQFATSPMFTEAYKYLTEHGEDTNPQIKEALIKQMEDTKNPMLLQMAEMGRNTKFVGKDITEWTGAQLQDMAEKDPATLKKLTGYTPDQAMLLNKDDGVQVKEQYVFKINVKPEKAGKEAFSETSNNAASVERLLKEFPDTPKNVRDDLRATLGDTKMGAIKYRFDGKAVTGIERKEKITGGNTTNYFGPQSGSDSSGDVWNYVGGKLGRNKSAVEGSAKDRSLEEAVQNRIVSGKNPYSMKDPRHNELEERTNMYMAARGGQDYANRLIQNRVAGKGQRNIESLRLLGGAIATGNRVIEAAAKFNDVKIPEGMKADLLAIAKKPGDDSLFSKLQGRWKSWASDQKRSEQFTDLATRLFLYAREEGRAVSGGAVAQGSLGELAHILSTNNSFGQLATGVQGMQQAMKDLKKARLALMDRWVSG